MFPGLDDDKILERLTAYLDKGYALASDDAIAEESVDAAAFAYANYLAYKQRLIQLSNQAATVTIASEGSKTHTDEQRAFFEKEMNGWLARYNGLVPEGTTAESVLIPPTLTTRPTFDW